jgi:hypothetical protein
MANPCSKEKEIDRLSKAVFGNGEQGLVQNTATILEKIDNIEQTLTEIRPGISALMKFQAEVLTERNIKEKNSMNGWQKAGIIISSIIGVSAVVASIIFKS